LHYTISHNQTQYGNHTAEDFFNMCRYGILYHNKYGNLCYSNQSIRGRFMKLISACLAGIPCRYDGQAKGSAVMMELEKSGQVRTFCPETLGGLEIPRVPSEIVGGDGNDVLDGKAKVMSRDGVDVTAAFIRGAEAVLALCRKFGVDEVLLKSKSPSCGVGRIYDGSFTGTLHSGDGVTAALLKRNSIIVVEID
jgi:uncharacterized protein YbbK (DUF523 family)